MNSCKCCGKKISTIICDGCFTQGEKELKTKRKWVKTKGQKKEIVYRERVKIMEGPIGEIRIDYYAYGNQELTIPIIHCGSLEEALEYLTYYKTSRFHRTIDKYIRPALINWWEENKGTEVHTSIRVQQQAVMSEVAV